jgi:hypothetical protein
LVSLLLRCRSDQHHGAGGAGLLHRLHEQAGLRAPLFAPAAERARLLQLVAELAARQH